MTMKRVLAVLAAILCTALAPACALAQPQAAAGQLAEAYARSVDRRLQVPGDELARYAALAEEAFARASVTPGGAQYVVLVDRDPQVQALLLLWRGDGGAYALVGASPVSTGAPGSFDHFETPTGVFEHGPWNPDFRAEGTFNENGIRGYGVRGLRVYDFGWQRVPKGWSDHAVIQMRLQMHATDPDALEPRLGSAQSKGCVRIPAALNQLLDHYGVLDAAYEQLVAQGPAPWVLSADREPVAGAGRYLVVVDSRRTQRPSWSPAPALPHRR